MGLNNDYICFVGSPWEGEDRNHERTVLWNTSKNLGRPVLYFKETNPIS